jgi:hypothetical protein
MKILSIKRPSKLRRQGEGEDKRDATRKLQFNFLMAVYYVLGKPEFSLQVVIFHLYLLSLPAKKCSASSSENSQFF